jgi:DNA-binding response OmpR family regulator
MSSRMRGLRPWKRGTRPKRLNKWGRILLFDAVIIDVGLPDKPGDVLADELRGNWTELPIVIASGHDQHVLARRFAHDGHVRVLGKPYYGDMLLAALSAMGVSADGK